jgi:hypothetical protein
MAEYKLRITNDRPFFAELPYYLWGQVNYDSEGDCRTPLDRNWKWMELTHRETDEHLDIASDGNEWTISGPDPAAARLAFFMLKRCNAENVGPYLEDQLRSWNHNEAAARATRVAAEFQNELLMPFANGHMFWGSWKWIGWFGTEFTWVGRWIMDSVVRNDARAVNLCIYWLRNGTCHESQSKTLRYALERFTGQSYATDAEWLQWYDSVGSATYPEPDFDKWYADLKAIHGE